MNKKILKLADEARFVDEIPYPDQDVIFERFAHLIINDCAFILHLAGEHEGRRRILKHFGMIE